MVGHLQVSSQEGKGRDGGQGEEWRPSRLGAKASARVFSSLGTSDSLCPLLHRLEEVPLEVLRQRESKWLDMLNNWDKWMAKKHKKVRCLWLEVTAGEEVKREELPQLWGAGTSLAATCPRCPHWPAQEWEQKLAGGRAQASFGPPR